MSDSEANLQMGQTPTASSKAESHTRGVEIECLVPRQADDRFGIAVGACHQAERLPHPSRRAGPRGGMAACRLAAARHCDPTRASSLPHHPEGRMSCLEIAFLVGLGKQVRAALSRW